MHNLVFLLGGIIAGLIPDSYVVKSPNFIVEAPSLACAKRVSYDAEKARQEFAQIWLGRKLADWEFPVPIMVRTKLGPSEKENGYTYFIGSVFYYISVEGHDEEEVEEMIPHEVGHAVIGRETAGGKQTQRWVHEGVCVAYEVLSGRYPKRYHDQLGRMALSDFLRLHDIPILMTGHAFYGEAGSISLYIRGRWGHEKFWEFVKVGNEMCFEGAAHSVLGIELSELQQQWETYLYQMDCLYPRNLRGTR